MRRLAALRARLDESLFPGVAPFFSIGEERRHAFSRGEAAVLLGAALVLGTVGQLLRPGFSASLNSLWAEDGPIFLQAAATQGFLDAVFTPYAGYLVVVPRLIGEAAALVPLTDAAAAVAILSAAVAALSAIAVWEASAGHVPSPVLRGGLAALTVLAPVAGLESLDSAAYVPWYMLFATFWLLLWRPRTALGAAGGALFVLATGLSTPGVWFFAPLAALRALAVRSRRDLAIVAAFWAGALAQVPVLLLNGEEAVEPAWSAEIWAAYAQRVVDGAAFGERLGGAAWAHLGWPFLVAVLLAAVGVLAIGLRRSGPGARWLAALAVPISFALFAVSAYQRAVGDQIAWPAGNYHGAAGRYAIVPALLLVGVALAILSDRGGGEPRPPRPGWLGLSWLQLGALALMVAAIVTSFDVREPAVRGTPPWDEAVRGAASTCVNEPAAAAAIATSPPGFGLSLPCDRLAEYAVSGRP